jgi:peptidoglycan hydrolase CwlO-like protein
MTETTTRKGEELSSFEQEIAALDEEIARMEAELAEESAPLVWGEASAEELVRKEQRLGVLPRLITAAKIKRLELVKQRTQGELEPLYKEREAAGKKLERLRKKRLEMEEEILEAQAAWGDPNTRIDKRQRRLKDLERQIRELREGR